MMKEKRMKKAFLFIFIVAVFPAVLAGDEEKSLDYSGFLRTAMVSKPAFSNQTFSVIHARSGVSGRVSRDLYFKLYMEFSNRGSVEEVKDASGILTGVDIKMPVGLLDAYMGWDLTDHLSLMAGQFKLPYSDSNLRSPSKMPFINRPVTREATPGIRDIGCKLIYRFSALPIVFETGLFNGSGMNALDRDRSLTGTGRVVWNLTDSHRLSGNFYGGRQDGTVLKMANAGYEYQGETLSLAAEYALRYDDDTPVQAGHFFLTKSLETAQDKIHKVTPAFRLEWNDFKNDAVTLTGGVTGHLYGHEYTFLRFNAGWNPDSGDTFMTLLFQITW